MVVDNCGSWEIEGDVFALRRVGSSLGVGRQEVERERGEDMGDSECDKWRWRNQLT